MLSVFPSLLSWSLFSPFIIRIALAAVLIFWAYKTFSRGNADMSTKAISLLEGIAGILLIIGLWTQVAALIIALDLLYKIGQKVAKKSFLTDGVNYYLILLVLALSLLITGPGLFAIDYPF